MKVIWIAIGLLGFSTSSYAQIDCDQVRKEATWQTTNLFQLTYDCIPKGWESFFNDVAVKAEVKKISDKLQAEVQVGDDVNPAIGNVFRALYVVPPSGIKAIIVGQDPAPTRGQATGLAFSLAPGMFSYKVASVQRVMLEAQNEGFANNLNDGDLSAWADEGVLMLNTALTIPCKQGATSCKIAGHLTLWKPFSKQLITEVEKQNSAVAFILWGSKAAALAPKVTNPLHRVFKGGHPSPLSNPTNFFCKSYFTCSNTWLTDHAVSAVNWNVEGGMTLPQACIWTKGMTPKCTATCTPAVCN